MADGGWKNADDKMRMIKCKGQNVNDNIKLKMFSYILSCKIRPREFIDRTAIFLRRS